MARTNGTNGTSLTLVGTKKRGRPATGNEELPILNLRVPQEMLDAIDAVGKAAGIENRSHVVRTLLYQALESEPARANVVQVLYDFGNIRQLIARRIMGRFAKVAPKLVDEVLREAME